MNGAVITAKNEVETIHGLVTALKSQGLDVCVVDDGSIDGTGFVASKAGAFVIRHDNSVGIGKSLVEAWRYAIEQGWESTVQIDAGGSHNPSEIYGLHDSSWDIWVGSRFQTDSQYTGRKWRAFASCFVAGALNWATYKKITDWTSGYRVFSRRALLALVDVHYMTNMHTWQIEVLHAAIIKGLDIAEFPITYKAGNSTMKWKTIGDLIRVYLWVLNY